MRIKSAADVLSRRDFLQFAGAAVAGVGLLGSHRSAFGQAALADIEIRFGAADEVPPADAGIDRGRLDDLTELFQKQIRDGIHPGAQLTVIKGDQVVFDRWGGIAIKPTTQMRHDTKMLLFSSTKPLGAVCTMMLVEQGDLELDSPVAGYWPAFARNDPQKEQVTVRHVLGHQGGFPTGPPGFAYEHFNDPAAAMRAMERVELKTDPGSKFEYHPLNYGWVLGELIRRTSGMPVDRFMRERLFEPLGCLNSSLGVPADELDEVSFMYRVTDREHPIEIWNSPSVRQASCCAACGHMPASDLAKFYRMLARGGLTERGDRLLSEATVRLMTTRGTVEKTGEKSSYGLGFAIGRTAGGDTVGGSNFGHGGSASSFGWCERELDLVAAFITNGHQEGVAHRSRMAAISDSVRALVG